MLNWNFQGDEKGRMGGGGGEAEGETKKTLCLRGGEDIFCSLN